MAPRCQCGSRRGGWEGSSIAQQYGQAYSNLGLDHIAIPDPVLASPVAVYEVGGGGVITLSGLFDRLEEPIRAGIRFDLLGLGIDSWDCGRCGDGGAECEDAGGEGAERYHCYGDHLWKMFAGEEMRWVLKSMAYALVLCGCAVRFYSTVVYP